VRLVDRRTVVLALCLGALHWSYPAFAQSSQDLEGVERELQQGEEQASALERKAATLDQEIQDLREALIEGAKAVQDAEQQVGEIEAALAELEGRERQRFADLAQQREELARLLMALERLAARPMLAVFFTDRQPVDEARAGRLLAIATQALQARAATLSNELIELGKLRGDVAARREDLSQSISVLSEENRKLAALVKKKSKLQASTIEETEATRQRMAKLSEQARNLKDLLERLEAAAAREPDEPAPGSPPPAERLVTLEPAASQEEAPDTQPPQDFRPFPAEGAFLVRPVRGKISAGFGGATETLGKSTGLVFAARAQAEVVAPFDGKVVFEGPFRNYGQILIIEHTGGYHSVLAGLGRAEVKVGQWLAAGEPVGAMAQGAGDELYFELRKDGRPIDPTPWLGEESKASAQNN
jgi:septal ring factor EnvC (AmiA/AmiB activator)